MNTTWLDRLVGAWRCLRCALGLHWWEDFDGKEECVICGEER